MEPSWFVQFQLYPFVWYRKEMFLLFHMVFCLVFGHSKKKIGMVCALLKTYFNTEDYV